MDEASNTQESSKIPTTDNGEEREPRAYGKSNQSDYGPYRFSDGGSHRSPTLRLNTAQET